jgi:hypothetical protein
MFTIVNTTVLSHRYGRRWLGTDMEIDLNSEPAELPEYLCTICLSTIALDTVPFPADAEKVNYYESKIYQILFLNAEMDSPH